MRLKLYRASGMAEAMSSIRAELGVDALILSTRRVGSGVEVTAALPDEDDHPPPPPPPAPDPERLASLAFHNVPAALADQLRHGELSDALGQALPFAPLPLSHGARPLLFAGPAGAGKTLTVARLAARRVIGGVSPSVVTADGRRAGATEQLAAFTRLLGLNLLVANHPATLGRAMAHRQAGAPVLIDAPGSDPFDPAQREEVAALAADLAAAFAAAGATMLVATRLDVTRRLGAVLAAAHAGGLALAEAGIGPGAADGLVPMTPGLLAERLLAAPPQIQPDRAP